MSIFRRFVTTVHTSVDRRLASIENHEAVVDAALKESRQAVARAKVRLARLEKDGVAQRNRVTELASEIELWNERALSVAGDDRARALSCIQRRKQRETEIEIARTQLSEHEAVIKRVRRSIDESANRVQALHSQRNQMRSREAASQAGRIVSALDGKVGGDVEAAIERWEVTVGEAEILTDTVFLASPDADELAREFTFAEENHCLEAELDELIQREGQDHE